MEREKNRKWVELEAGLYHMHGTLATCGRLPTPLTLSKINYTSSICCILNFFGHKRHMHKDGSPPLFPTCPKTIIIKKEDALMLPFSLLRI